jgi:hypothetical protein
VTSEEAKMLTMKDLKKLDRDDLLEWVGLQTKRDAMDWILPALGVFGAGLVVGAGLGLLLAPKPGRELREDLKHRVQGGAQELSKALTSAGGEKSPVRPL